MSNALAIAAVTAVLRDLLNNGLVEGDVPSQVGAVQVTALPPSAITVGQEEPARLNLFLYRVTPNQGWRNDRLPSRSPDGARMTNPALALDLHYLLTAYGGDEFVPEILLGYAMQILHETPCLTRDAIREALAAPSPVGGAILPPGFKTLVAADLADQVEQVKLVPETLSIEDMGKLWGTFLAPYRVSAAYSASVVLIESQKSTRSALPVLKYRNYVIPLVRPQIASIASDAAPGADPRITGGSTIVISGANLRGQVTRVRLGEFFVPGPSLTISGDRISFPLAGISGLRAGIVQVQVVHELLMGEPEPGVPHRGVESNPGAFVLHPAITVPPTITAGAGSIDVGFTPAVGPRQRVTLLLVEKGAPDDRPARAYSFAAPGQNGIVAPATETATIGFPFAGVAPGDYLAYAQVDGAESLLGLDGSGVLASPVVTVT